GGEGGHVGGAVHRLENLRGHPSGLDVLLVGGFALRGGVSSARSNGQARPIHPDLDFVELSVPLGARRVIGHDIVRTVVTNDAIEGVGEVVRVDGGKATALVGEPAQAVLGSTEVVVERL